MLSAVVVSMSGHLLAAADSSVVFSRVEESMATFPQTKDVSFLCRPCKSECLWLIGGRQAGGRDQSGSCVTLSESDTSSILCIFLAPAQHA